MSDLDVNHELKNKVVQPQFTRHHHSYRSPMSSEIINLEINQFRFDLAKIYKKGSDLISNFQAKMEKLHKQIDTLDGCMFYRASDQSSGAFTINNLEFIASKLEVLKSRLDRLERGF